MYFKNLLLNSFFLFLFFGAFAQNESVIREQIHSNDGLPLGWVTGVAQDPRGFIWIGGKKKIFRYDGFSLLQIDANSTLLPLDFNDNCEIVINKKGELLVMDRSNFYRIDPNNFRLLSKLSLADTVQRYEGFRPAFLRFAESDDGNIYATNFGSQSSADNWIFTLFSFSPEGRLLHVSELNSVARNSPDFFKTNQALQVVCGNQVYKVDKTGKVVAASAIVSRGNWYMDHIFLDGEQTLWVKMKEINKNRVADNSVLFCRRKGENEFRSFGLPRDLNVFDLWSFVKLGDYFWFFNKDRELLKIHIPPKTWTNLDQGYSTRKIGLTGQYETIRFATTEPGVFWNCTSSGLTKIIDNSLPVEEYFTGVSADCFYGYCSMRGMTEDPEGNLYFSYYNNISKLNPRTGETETLLPVKPTFFHGAFSANWLDDYLYFGDFKIDAQSGKFKRLLPPNQDGHVTNLVARDGSIWLFKWQPFGLYRYFPQKDSLQKIDFTGWAPPLGAEVNPMIQMPETGEVWAPTNVSGILVFAEDGKYLRTINGKNPDDPPLPSVNVKVLYLSDDSTMWIGHDLGFCRLNLKTNTINRYRIRNSNNYEVVGILEDEEQNLWLSTNHGIFLFNVATETFAGFPAYAAIANAEYNRSSFYKASSGKMYFGTLNGVFGFEPEVARDFIAGQKGKRVVLTRISIFNNGTKKFRNLERDLGSIKNIELKHDDGFLNISFAVLDQKSTGNNYFTYKLEGMDAEWSEPNTFNQLRYNNLPDGNYTLRIRGGASEQNFTESERVIAVIVKKAWFTLLWFRLLIVVALFGIVQLFFRIRLAQKLKEERMRTRLSSDLHDDVGSLLSGIAMQSEILEVSAIESRKPQLHRLTDMSRSALSRMRDIVWAIDARKDSMQDLVDRLLDQGLEILNPADIEFAVNCEFPPAKKLKPTVRQHLYLICKEAITNTLRHSNADKMEIAFRQEGSSLLLVIRDNGQLKNKNLKTSGLGLSNMQMRAALIKGQLEIITDQGFEIRLLLKKF